MDKAELLIGELSGKVQEGFVNIYHRLDGIDDKLLAIEKNNTQQKLQSQKNTQNIKTLDNEFQRYITASKNNEKLRISKAQLKYSKWKIFISILEATGTFGLGYFIRDIVFHLLK